MTRRPFVAILASMLGAARISTSFATSVGHGSPDEALIKKLYTDMMDAVRRQDTDAVVRAYAPEHFVYLDVSIPRAYYGREGARKTWDAWFSMIVPGSGTGEATELQITVAGEYAFAMHFDRYTAQPKDSSLVWLKDFTNRATSWLKKINGNWYILVEHNSFPVDLIARTVDFRSKAD